MVRPLKICPNVQIKLSGSFIRDYKATQLFTKKCLSVYIIKYSQRQIVAAQTDDFTVTFFNIEDLEKVSEIQLSEQLLCASGSPLHICFVLTRKIVLISRLDFTIVKEVPTSRDVWTVVYHSTQNEFICAGRDICCYIKLGQLQVIETHNGGIDMYSSALQTFFKFPNLDILSGSRDQIV